MSKFFKMLSIIFKACRGYSVPISIMSWIVPFTFALFNGGSFLYGVISLLGIVILHMATNLFDDAVDYTIEKIKIEKGVKSDFNFQTGKCITIFDGSLTLKQTYLISFFMFLIVMFIGLFFIFIYGFELLYIIVPSAILCLLYPILGSIGFGEIIVAIIFSPMIYMGVYFVMTGNFVLDILLISISTGFLTVAVYTITCY